jgi:signal peptidase II
MLCGRTCAPYFSLYTNYNGVLLTTTGIIFAANTSENFIVRYRHAILIVLLVIIADQFSKFYIKTNFYYGEEINVLGNWFRLHFIENEGMAFGMRLSDAATGKLILTLFRLVAVVFGFFLLKRLVDKKYHTGLLICGSLILAGALGNLIDSIFYGMIFTESSFHIAKLVPFGEGYGKLFHGRVVDMLYFPLIDTTWPSWVPVWGGKPLSFFEPVFNIADAAISCGVITLLLFQKRFMQKDEPANKETVATE